MDTQVLEPVPVPEVEEDDESLIAPFDGDMGEDIGK